MCFFLQVSVGNHEHLIRFMGPSRATQSCNLTALVDLPYCWHTFKAQFKLISDLCWRHPKRFGTWIKKRVLKLTIEDMSSHSNDLWFSIPHWSKQIRLGFFKEFKLVLCTKPSEQLTDFVSEVLNPELVPRFHNPQHHHLLKSSNGSVWKSLFNCITAFLECRGVFSCNVVRSYWFHNFSHI